MATTAYEIILGAVDLVLRRAVPADIDLSERCTGTMTWVAYAHQGRQQDACVFCRIVAGREPAAVVYENAATLAFLDVAPVAEGHTLVVPKMHADNLLTASEDDAVAVMRTVHLVVRRLDKTLRPDGITLFQANRAAGWQDVFHLHLHIVPRWKDDQLVRSWSRSPSQGHDRLARVAERVSGSEITRQAEHRPGRSVAPY